MSEIHGIYDWRTVTAHGSVYMQSDADSGLGSAEFAEALARLRSVVPAVFTPRDPMPQRVQLFRLHADDLIGGEVSSNARGKLPPP